MTGPFGAMGISGRVGRTDDATVLPFGNFFAGKRALITGGMGFLGGHVARRLVALGADVTIFDIDICSERDSIVNDRRERLRPRMHLVEGDIGNASDVNKLMGEKLFDVVFHFAAFSVIEKSANAPVRTIETNALGTAHLLEGVRNSRSEPSAIVISSTDKVYGEMEMETERYSEQSPLRGVGIYDAAKLAGDVFAQTYHHVFGQPTVVMRLCNLFGPHDYNVGFRLFPKALTSLFSSAEPITPVLYFNSLNHFRDYLYIDDAVRAFLLVASTPSCAGEVFNISAAHHASTPEVMRLIVEQSAAYEALFDRDRAKKICEHGISIVMRNGSSNVVAISRQHLDGSKLEAATGFVPEVRFVEGLQRTVEFYRSHYERARVFASV